MFCAAHLLKAAFVAAFFTMDYAPKWTKGRESEDTCPAVGVTVTGEVVEGGPVFLALKPRGRPYAAGTRG